MNYLRSFEKMNGRHLFDEDKMIEGNEDIIWEFLDDIWHWANNKAQTVPKRVSTSPIEKRHLIDFS